MTLYKNTIITLCLGLFVTFSVMPSCYSFAPRPNGMTRADRSLGEGHLPRLMMSDDFFQETPDATQERIQDLVDTYPVLLFMKGSKLFPQCGFR